MKGAELFVITGSSASVQVQKYWSTEYGPPSLSPEQDATVVSGSRGNGTTTAVFKRALNPCTPHSLELKENYNHNVIWAVGSSDTLAYHGPDNRGTTQIVFRQVDTPFHASETDLTDYTVAFKNYTIPTNQTTYTCMTGKLSLPDPNRKYHIVRASGVPQSKLVHHMILCE
ncbi:hypothetical protein HDV00_004200 [Rhizophlyctis rosea]|nr:hypothetical protein HDV00_004200 [Rhizophlyctis rosea]